MEIKSLNNFKSSLTASARGLWSGQLDSLSFADSFFSTLRRGLTQAWYEGAKEFGIKPDELSEEELAVLAQKIGDNNQYVGGLADFISQHTKAQGFSFETIKPRLDLWINRYEEVKELAKSMAGGNRKLRWDFLGLVKEHCRSCLKLKGRVARSKTWAERGLYPRATNGTLACGGFHCGCGFTETDEPVTRGRWPKLP